VQGALLGKLLKQLMILELVARDQKALLISADACMTLTGLNNLQSS
jgi:hypothetical protein